MDVSVARDVFLFGGFRLDRRSGGLFRQDDSGGFAPIEIGSRALDVLDVLVAHHGEVLSKHVIMRAVWADVAVDEKNLAVQISTLRRVLDSGRTEPSCIQTEAGRGYRFISAVTRLDGGAVTNTRPPEEDVLSAPAVVPDNGDVRRSPPPTFSLRRRPRWQKLAGFAVLLPVVGVGAALWVNRERPVPAHQTMGDPVPLLPRPRLRQWGPSSRRGSRWSCCRSRTGRRPEGRLPGRRHHGRSDHRPVRISERSWSRGNPPTPTRARPRTCGRSAANSACAMCSKAACAGSMPRCGSMFS